MDQVNCAVQAMRVLKDAGVEHLFTLSGGHIFPRYDGCRDADVRLVDVRHEQTAGFAAEGLAKLTRRPQVAAVTAGPGVTNVMSPIATAHVTGSPLVVLAGRAAEATWGIGSLQEIDHAQQTGRRYCYLGYWIAACPSMAYKSRFGPHQLLDHYPADDEEPVWHDADELQTL
jgi:thiamine pyrophosphate-dependent acetolactate synthase large subunit-like protein